MYNPAREPYVSHFSGTDLIIDHIERLVCPTITSDQILRDPQWKGKPFRFAKDHRRHIGVVISESEYSNRSNATKFLEDCARRDHRLSFVFGDSTQENALPGIEQLGDVDLLIISVRRRTPPPEQLAVVRKLVAAGTPVIGIRTASHAFCIAMAQCPKVDRRGLSSTRKCLVVTTRITMAPSSCQRSHSMVRDHTASASKRKLAAFKSQARCIKCGRLRRNRLC